MEKTITIYDTEPRQDRFTATVLSCAADGDGFLAVLDRTAFFPEQGGQYADRGTLRVGDSCASVLDVQITDGIITHRLSAPLPVGAQAEGFLDWGDRYDKMQQHTAEHIVSGLVHKHFGFHNVGFRLGPEHVTMDYDGEATLEQMLAIEREANEAVWKNLPVQVSYPTKEELERLAYRSKIEIEGQVRIVTVPGYDVCACCAPHVERTGEIGLIKIVSLQRYKGGIRVYMLCGGRALADYNSKMRHLTAASNLLSVKDEMTEEAVERLQTENVALRVALNAAKRSLLEQKVAALSGSEDGTILLFEEGLEARDMQNAVNAMTERFGGYCGIFNGSDREGYRFVLGSKKKDCRQAAASLKEIGAKGGGSPQMVQGSIAAREKSIREALAER